MRTKNVVAFNADAENAIAKKRNVLRGWFKTKTITQTFIGKSYKSVMTIADNGLKRFIAGKTTKVENAALVALIKAWHEKQSSNLEQINEMLTKLENEQNYSVGVRHR